MNKIKNQYGFMVSLTQEINLNMNKYLSIKI